MPAEAPLGSASGPHPSWQPSRIEFTNCHEWANRFEEALDARKAQEWLLKVRGELSETHRQLLCTVSVMERRNSRALVFVPCIPLAPGTTFQQRVNLLEAIRAKLDSGCLDLPSGRRPRARFDPRPEMKPMNRTMAMARRLSERINASLQGDAPLEWQVQLAGRKVELWAMLSDRPRLVATISESLSLDVASPPSGVTAEALEDMWRMVRS